jgi:hypothetical protein
MSKIIKIQSVNFEIVKFEAKKLILLCIFEIKINYKVYIKSDLSFF